MQCSRSSRSRNKYTHRIESINALPFIQPQNFLSEGAGLVQNERPLPVNMLFFTRFKDTLIFRTTGAEALLARGCSSRVTCTRTAVLCCTKLGYGLGCEKSGLLEVSGHCFFHERHVLVTQHTTKPFADFTGATRRNRERLSPLLQSTSLTRPRYYRRQHRASVGRRWLGV